MVLEFSHQIGHSRGKFGQRQFARARTRALCHIGETEAVIQQRTIMLRFEPRDT
jgi:hypothetical protein